MKNKKGLELSMNIIIIAILVILVLVIVAVFVTGGLANLFGKIKILYGGQATDISSKQASCNSACLQYETSNKNLIYETAYCAKTVIDKDLNGVIDTVEKQGFDCKQLGFTCNTPIDC